VPPPVSAGKIEQWAFSDPGIPMSAVGFTRHRHLIANHLWKPYTTLG
jgi:hypothetical protein